MQESYKTEELIGCKMDIVYHVNLYDAWEWTRNGSDVKIYHMDGDKWVKLIK